MLECRKSRTAIRRCGLNKQQNHRRNANQWQKIIKDHKASGQSAASYCREQKFSEKSFYAWRKRLSQQSTSVKKEFIEVTSLDKSDKEPLRIKTPGGYCIEVSSGTESSLIQDVIKMLELK